MGMYTALHIATELRADTPQEVINTLIHMLGGSQEPTVSDHPLFQTARWDRMLCSSSAYFPFDGNRGSGIQRHESGGYDLTVLSSFKNYDDEIGKFVDWLSPYVSSYQPKWIGYRWYEEDDEPTGLYRKEVLPCSR